MFLNGMLWSFVQQFSTQLTTFIVQLILVRFISPADFGLIGMLVVFIGIGTVIIDGGMTSSLIRDNNANDSDYSTIFYYTLTCSIIVYFIFYSLTPFIAKFYNQNNLIKIGRVYGLTFIFSTLGTVQNIILIKKMKFKAQAIITIPPLFLGGIFGVILSIYNFGAWSLIYSMLATSILTSLSLWIFSGWRPLLEFNIIKFKKHFNYGYKMSISSALDNLFTNIYPILIGKLYNPSIVGYYTRANSLMMLPVGNISIILNRVVFPLFSKVQDDIIELKKIYKKIMQIIFYILAPTTALMILLSREIVILLFTEKWVPIIPIFQVLCFVGLLYPLHLYNLMILQVKGKSALFLKLEVFKKIIIVVSLIVSIKFGLMGILFGSVFASFISLPVNTYYAGDLINYKLIEQLKDLIPIFFSTAIMSIIIFLFHQLIINYSGFLIIILSTIIGVISYLILSFVLKIDSAKELLLLLKSYANRDKKIHT